MEDRNEETWWLFYLHGRKKNLYYITINKWQQLLDPKKLLFSPYIKASRFATEVFFCYLRSIDFIVVSKFYF